MTRSLSFTRDYYVNILLLMAPSKLQERARVILKDCNNGECKNSVVDRDIRKVKVESEQGLSIDIEEPHEIRFSFDGNYECKREGELLDCVLGQPTRKEISPSGELVNKRVFSDFFVHNIPIIHTFIFKAPIENRNNHWYMEDKLNDIHEMNINPEKVRSVELNLHHPMLTTAKINLKEKINCTTLSDAKWIVERRKLYCP